MRFRDSSPSPATPSQSESRSVFTVDMVANGSFETKGNLDITDDVEGDVTAHAITIHEGASFKGSLSAESITINGTVNGNLSAKSIDILGKAKVDGELRYDHLSVDRGSNVELKCIPRNKP